MPACPRSVVSLLEEQHALVTRAQLLEREGGHATLRRMQRNGAWTRLDEGLYGPTGVPMSWRRRLMAAVLLAPLGSLVSHRGAAALIGVGGLVEPTPEITIPRGTTFRRADVITHESTDLDLAHPTRIDGIPTTGPLRLAMDLGAVVSRSRFRHTMRELRHSHGVRNEALLRTYLRHKRRGRNGGAALHEWLDRYFAIGGVSESGLELTVLDAILDAGLAAPTRQHWVDTDGGWFRLDLAYPDLMLAIEVDGVQHREDSDIVVADAARTRALEAAGWTIIRVRSWRFVSDLAAALDQLRRNLVDS